MKKTIRLTENELVNFIKKSLGEQDSSVFDILKKSLEKKPLGKKILDTKEKWNTFSTEIRPKIEANAENFFPANKKARKNPKYKGTSEWRKLKDKEDAFGHQLASAMAVKLFGEGGANLIGIANEINGGIKVFQKGNSSRNIPKYSSFCSGCVEDEANNKLGREIAVKSPNQSFEYYQQQVLNNIKTGNYYNHKGEKVGNI